MGDQQNGLFPALVPHRLEDDALVQAVEVGGRLVQQEEGRIVEEGAGHADALALAAGEGTAQLAHRGIVALGQLPDETVQRRLFAGRFHLGTGGIAPGNFDIVLDGVVEQFRLLRHKALLRPQRSGIHAADVLCTKADAAAGNIPETEQQPQEGGFSAAGAARDAHNLPFGDGQAQVVQDFLVRVSEADLPGLGTGKGRVGPIGHVGRDRFFVQQVQNFRIAHSVYCIFLKKQVHGSLLCYL